MYLKTKEIGLNGAPMHKYSDDDIEFVSNSYLTMSDEEIGHVLHRTGKSIKEFRRKLGLYRKDPNDITRYRNITRFIQANNTDWKRRSMANCEYKCVLTGGDFDDIHHLYAKNLIIIATLEKLSFSEDIDINECDDNTKELILQEFYKEQDKHPLGVCLSEKLHRQFHVLYGFGNNTPEQFYEFASKFPQSKLCIDTI